MPAATMKQLLEAGVHFGHQTKRWNPKMRPFIYGARNGIYIIDLQKTVRLFREAYNRMVDTVGRGQSVMFVATKAQAKDVFRDEAKRSEMPYVVNRWLGGTLTNFKTIQSSVKRMKEIEAILADTENAQRLTKKERTVLDKEHAKLHFNFEGIRDMEKLPGIVFIMDTIKETIAVHEANKLGIPVVAVVDTNCDPGPVDYVVPGNDDSIRAIRLFAGCVGDACLEGMHKRDEQSGGREKPDIDRAAAAKHAAEAAASVVAPTFPGEGPEVIVKRPRGYFARGITNEDDEADLALRKETATSDVVAPPIDTDAAAAVPVAPDEK